MCSFKVVFMLVDELGLVLIDVLVLVLVQTVQVLCYFLVESLVCVPLKHNFSACKTALSEMSCVNLWKVTVYCDERHERSVNMPRG